MGRPTQLSRSILFSLVALLVISFITGIGLWFVHEQREKMLEVPRWTHACRTLHGVVNPLICILYGWLWYSHIPGGWNMRANRKSGATLVGTLGLLILTGAGIYYSDESRHTWFTIHLLFGLILPIAVAVHWFSARRWVRSRGAD